ARGDPVQELASRIVQITLDPAAGYKDAMRPQVGRGWILGADDPLVDVETAEMVRWLQQRGRNGLDVRFRLRHALHAKEIYEKYQLVLIDCPPRLTTACVNALAASDYVLIPVIRDRASTERVPALLTWLSQLYARGVCEGLNGVGVVANNTHENADEREAW